MCELSNSNPPFGSTAGFRITNIADDAFIDSIIARGVLPGQESYEPVGAAVPKANERRVIARKAGAA